MKTKFTDHTLLLGSSQMKISHLIHQQGMYTFTQEQEKAQREDI